MKQKQQNKHSGSARARSDLCIMDKQNRLKSTLEGKINRIETFIESANEETDSVEIKVKLRNLIQLQKNAEELCNNYYAIPNVKDAELTAVDEDLHLLEVRLESLENITWKLKTIISNEDSSFAEPVDFLIVDKITEFTPSSSLDISNAEIPKFLTLAGKSFFEANEIHALISADIFFKVLKQNTYKVNEELFFKESEFGWIACGKLEERQTNKQGQCFLVNNDSIQDTLKLFFDLEGLGIRDDPVLHERDQAIEIFKETVEFEKGRYIVQLPFRKSYNELSDNYPLAKQRFQNLWRRFGHNLELYQQYREIIRDYTEQGIIEEVKTEITDNKLKRDLFLTNLCLADEHKDAVRFLWSDDEPCVHKRPKLQVYRLNRVKFGVSSSPFLLAATIRHHIEKYKHEFPDTVELLGRNFYDDDLISGGNEFEEALQTSRRAKNIMEAAGMDLRKWITNDANLMEQWKKENFNVHPVQETVSLGANGAKVLRLSWNTNEDYLTTDTKSLLEFVSLDKNTKRFILQAVGKMFDPLGLISPFTVRMKCLLQDLWKEEIQWDDPLPTHIEKE
ncbi:integrase catalytic domain-containing protein [Trichonephila clavipes]|nr:integrase catalytic domain-containing protein [Trichonephila clavipes]